MWPMFSKVLTNIVIQYRQVRVICLYNVKHKMYSSGDYMYIREQHVVNLSLSQELFWLVTPLNFAEQNKYIARRHTY